MQCEEAAHCSFDIFQISVMQGVLCNSVTVAQCSFMQHGARWWWDDAYMYEHKMTQTVLFKEEEWRE